jgi:hypothetical protein
VARGRRQGLVNTLGHRPSLVPRVPVADGTDGESSPAQADGIVRV